MGIFSCVTHLYVRKKPSTVDGLLSTEIQSVQECDATEYYSSTKAGFKKINSKISISTKSLQYEKVFIYLYDVCY
ncbi:hypothetical protein BH10BAC2_BH10BAC2_49890 [soil metagenome]